MRSHTDAPPPDRLELLTLSECVEILRRSRTSLYRDIAAGRLRTVKLHGSTRVPRAALEDFIANGNRRKRGE